MVRNYIIDNNKLSIEFTIKDEHIHTLFIVKANGDCVSFENRDMFNDSDLDGNEINWKICDDLVEMGLLVEDEESFDVVYEISENGNKVIDMLTNK